MRVSELFRWLSDDDDCLDVYALLSCKLFRELRQLRLKLVAYLKLTEEVMIAMKFNFPLVEST